MAAGIEASGSGRTVWVPAGYLDKWRVELMRSTARIQRERERQELLVGQALAAGATWSAIADALQTSRQSAHQRFRHLVVKSK